MHSVRKCRSVSVLFCLYYTHKLFYLVAAMFFSTHLLVFIAALYFCLSNYISLWGSSYCAHKHIFFMSLFASFVCSNVPLCIEKPGGNSAHVSANNVIGWLLQVIAGAIFLSSLPNGLPGRGSLTEIRRQANETLACQIRLQRWIVGREGGYSVCR